MPSVKRKLAPGEVAPYSQAELMSFADSPRPFKNPAYAKNLVRRNKTLKQVLAAEKERLDAVAAGIRAGKEGAASGEAMELDQNGDAIPEKSKEKDPADRQGEPTWDPATRFPMAFTTVDAPPSLLPQKKYCDVTGLSAPYTDPKMGLRYHNKEIYEVVNTFTPSVVQAYLGLRKKMTAIK